MNGIATVTVRLIAPHGGLPHLILNVMPTFDRKSSACLHVFAGVHDQDKLRDALLWAACFAEAVSLEINRSILPVLKKAGAHERH